MHIANVAGFGIANISYGKLGSKTIPTYLHDSIHSDCVSIAIKLTILTVCDSKVIFAFDKKIIMKLVSPSMHS